MIIKIKRKTVLGKRYNRFDSNGNGNGSRWKNNILFLYLRYEIL